MIVAGVLGVVWRLFGVCLEGFWWVSGLEGVWGLRKVSVGCLVGVWRVFGGVWGMSGGCLRDVLPILPNWQILPILPTSWHLTFHDIWHFTTFDIVHFITFDILWHLTFDISCHLTFHFIWHCMPFDISCHRQSKRKSIYIGINDQNIKKVIITYRASLELKNLCKLKHELHTVCKSSTTFYAIMCKGKVQKNPKTIIKC